MTWRKKLIFLGAFIQVIEVGYSQGLSHVGAHIGEVRFDMPSPESDREMGGPSDSGFTIVGEWHWGPCWAANVVGNHAYIGNGKLLQVLDITDPNVPKIVGEVATAGTVYDIRVLGSYAFVISPFQVIDVSDPTRPRLVSASAMGSTMIQMTIADSFAYIGDVSGTISIVDIRDPLNPQRLGRMLASGQQVSGIGIYGIYLYATTVDGLRGDVFDISDKSTPAHVGFFGFNGYAALGRAATVEAGFLYVGATANPTFLIYDLTTPASPTYVGGITTGAPPSKIVVRDTVAFLFQQVLSTVSVANKVKPNLIGQLSLPASNATVGRGSVDSGHVYIGSGPAFWVVDSQRLDSLRSASAFWTNWLTNRIAVDSSHHAYLASFHTGLRILDFSNSEAPKLVGGFVTPAPAGAIAVSANTVYLATSKHFHVIDVTTPAIPTELGRVTFPDSINDYGYGDGSLVLSGDKAFVSRSSRRFFVIDISDPWHPGIIAEFTTTGKPYGLSTVQKRLYVAEENHGLHVYSLGDSSTIVNEVDSLPNLVALGLCANGNELYVADDTGLMTLSIADSSGPILSGHVSTPNGRTAVDMAFRYPFVLMAYGSDFHLVDISNPYAPKLASDFVDYSGLGAVAATDSLMLVGNQLNGLFILRAKLTTGVGEDPLQNTPLNVRLYQNYPNPFNSSTTIRYALPERQHVRVIVYNLLGQMVTTLVDRIEEAGEKEVVFQANNLSSGVYFYRLETTRHALVRATVLMK